MPVELNIVESATTLDTTVVEVILTSASEPGPAGAGVPTGGTVGQVLTKDSGTDYDTSWQDATGGGGGAPTDVDYLVGTASGSLSAEIVVGTSPGGELGGTWASPTVDATHSGSSHASVQSAAEATAAAALAAHEADTTGIHGIANTASLETTAGAQAKVDTHVNDATDAHAGTAITNTPAGTIAATTVQAAINELDSEKAAAASAVMDGDAAGGVLSGTYPNPGFASDMATQAELDAHVSDTSAAHAASAISVDSTTLVGTGTDAQAVFEELDNGIADHLADATAAHAASAISFSPTGTIAATDVQTAIAEVASEAGGLFDTFAIIRDEKAANTNGGTFTSGAWRTRDLNTESYDPDGIVSIASNQFTLAAGSYMIRARAPAHGCNWHKTKLRNTTDASDSLIGTNACSIATDNVNDWSFVTGVITIAASKTFEIQHQCHQTKATNGLGVATNFGVVEVYTEVEIWRFA